jgi:hypothetical protein
MDLISRLEAARDRTLPFFDLPEADLEKRYAPGKWSVRFILHHLADTETVLYDRIRRVISEPRQVIWAFDQDAWAAHLGYVGFPLAASQRIFSAVREAVIHQARTHYEKNGDLEFVHSQDGVRTLRDEFEKVAWHNERHLAQIEDALALNPALPAVSALTDNRNEAGGGDAPGSRM